MLGDGTADPTLGNVGLWLNGGGNTGSVLASFGGMSLGGPVITGLDENPNGLRGGNEGDIVFGSLAGTSGAYWRCTESGDAAGATWILQLVTGNTDPITGGFTPPNPGAIWQDVVGTSGIWVSTGTSSGDWQSQNGSSVQGTPIVRAFSFAYDTPDLLPGVEVYAPSAGDLLYDAWIEVDEAWDGTTPHGDLGTFVGTVTGFYDWNKTPVDMTSVSPPGNGTGIVVSLNGPETLLTGGNSPLVLTDDPILLVVSQDGTSQEPASHASLTANEAPDLPLTITEGGNDTFQFGGNSSPPYEVFTIAPGTYTTLVDLETAVAAATGAISEEPLSTYATVSDDGTAIVLTAVVAGPTGNLLTIAEQDGGAAAIGFTSTDNMTDGAGGDPGATQGTGVLYLVMATPAT